MAHLVLRTRYASLMSRLRIAPGLWRDSATSLTALNYHYFTEREPECYLDVRESTVAYHLKILNERYRFPQLKPSLRQLTEQAKTSSDRPCVLITVDDGSTSFNRVLRHFEALDIPVCLFVPIGLCLGIGNLDGARSRCLRLYSEVLNTGNHKEVAQHPRSFFQAVMNANASDLMRWIERLSMLPREEDPISRQELYSPADLEKLTRHPLITIASHSMSHQWLTKLPDEWCRWEIEASAHHIAEIGGDPELFAYPYGAPGSFGGFSTSVLEQSSVKFAFCTQSQPLSADCSRYALGRSAVFDCADPHYIWGTAAGAFEWWGALRFGWRSA
jgi:peptidoglycan/xylan/chitin deacetylase (PgdA/CDA1 family)